MTETWLDKRNRLKAEEAREEARLADAVEREAMKRLAGELAKTMTSHGVGVVSNDAARVERERVAALVRQDQRDRAKDQSQRLADVEVSEGIYVNLSDTVIEPTPEWLDKADTVPFRPKQPKDTVREIVTVRRVSKPIVLRLCNAGKITDEQARACLRYQGDYEVASLDGRWSTTRFNPSGVSGGGAGAGGHMAMTEWEAEARERFRAARAAVTPFYLRFLDAVVIDEVPLRRASRFARCRSERTIHRFRQVAQELVDHYVGCGIDLSPRENEE